MMRMRGVNFTYDGEKQVLQDLDAEFGPGLTLLLGPNGCGKTTLLRVAAGVERPDAGHVEVDGIDLWKDEARARRALAYVPEQPDLTPFAGLAEILRLVCRLRGEPPQRALEALAQVGLADHAGHTVRQLSTGQRRRALVAAARIGAPPILLLDEPLEGLDRAMCDQVLAWIEERRAGGTTIVLVTHQIEPFVATAARAVGLREGRAVAIDPLPADQTARRAILERLARGASHTLDARAVRPGLWRWTVPHPDWTPDKAKPGGWDRFVGCVSYEPSDPREPFVLFDPLAPPAGTAEEEAFWKALDADVARRPAGVAVLLGNFWHDRSAEAIRRRYRQSPGCSLWAPPGIRQRLGLALDHDVGDATVLPAGIRAFSIEGLMATETIYWIPEHEAIVAADALIGIGQGQVRVPPSRWADEDPEGQRRYHDDLRPSLARLLELPLEIILVSHGEPVLRDGGLALRAGLEAPAWGD